MKGYDIMFFEDMFSDIFGNDFGDEIWFPILASVIEDEEREKEIRDFDNITDDEIRSCYE